MYTCLPMACTIMVSTLSGLNLSLYRERECERPRAIAFTSVCGRPDQKVLFNGDCDHLIIM